MNSSNLGRGITLAVAAMACGASTAPAQSPEPAMVPLELVEELSHPFMGGRGSLEVLVGRLPDAVARALPMAAEGRVIGTFVYDGYSISAIEVPGSRGQVHRGLVAGLLDSGWTRLEMRDHGGFETAPREGLQFCLGDSTTLNLDFSGKRRGTTIVRVTNATSGSRSVCAHHGPSGMARPESPFPSLYPPAGAETRRSGTGGGSDSWHTEGRVETGLTPVQLVDHYTAQLVEHGWTPLARAATADAVIQTFTFTHSDGKAWHGLLQATAPPGGGDRPVLLRVNSVEAERF